MIPLLALIITVYGTARLLNDCFAKHENDAATALTWFVSCAAIASIWVLVFLLLMSGSDLQGLS